MNIEKALDAVVEELYSATEKHGPFHSAHEGYAVILEELDELWDEIKLKNRNQTNIREEAVQVAAMALRFLVDIAEDEVVNEDQDLSRGCV